MDLKEKQVRSLLNRFGEALSDGDLLGIQSCWTIPALVLADKEAIPLLSSVEIERLFTRAIHVHRYRGLISEKPQVVRIEPMNDNLVSVEVRWPSTDKQGTQRIHEYTQYILGRGEDGEYRIRVALTRSLESAA
jgi:hypothetical protein